MKPIAVDLGKAYWVIARTDETGQPTVAGLGDGGLIPALITEYEGQLMIGQQIDPVEGVPYLRDCSRWALGGPEIRNELGQFLRDGANGEVEIYLAGEWWASSALLTRMFGDTTRVVKDYLAPNSSLPVVAAVPPDLDKELLLLYRKSMMDAGLTLAGWCPTPLALAFGDSDLLQREHTIAATLMIDWGLITLGIVEVQDGFAQLRVSKNLEWSWQQWGQQIPLEQVAELVEQVLSMAREFWDIELSAIDRLLIGGEEAWIHQLYPLLQDRIPAALTPFHQPRLAVSMGTALFAELLHEGLVLAPISSPTSSTQVTLSGFALPDSQIEVRGGAQDEVFTVDITGLVEHSISLIPDQENQLSISIRADDGRHFAMYLSVEHSSNVVTGKKSSSELKSYAGDLHKPAVSSEELPGWSGSSHTPLERSGEASLLMEEMGEASLLMEDDAGESTAEDLEVPDKEEDAPSSPGPPGPMFVANPGPAPLDEDLGDKTSMALAVGDVALFASIGEGDGETRILTTDSYAKLGINIGEKKEQEEVTGQEDGIEVIEDFDIIESIDASEVVESVSESDILESVSESDILESVSESDILESLEAIDSMSSPDGLEDDEVEEAFRVLVPEKNSVEIVAIAGEDLPIAPPAPEPLSPSGSEQELEVVLADTPLESGFHDSAPGTLSPSEPVSSLQEQAAPLMQQEEALRRDSSGSGASSGLHEKSPAAEAQDSPPVVVSSSNSEMPVVAKENGTSAPDNVAPVGLSSAPSEALSVAIATDEVALDPGSLMQKIETARRMAQEARAMMEESRSLVDDLESMLGPSLFALVWEQDEPGLEAKPMELSVRRETRKILGLAKQLTEVESNRLPTSSRKTLQRLSRDLEAQMQNEDGRIPVRLVLQLANRMFEMIRRDLRPW